MPGIKIQDGDCFDAKEAWNLKAESRVPAGKIYLLFITMADNLPSTNGSQRVNETTTKLL